LQDLPFHSCHPGVPPAAEPRSKDPKEPHVSRYSGMSSQKKRALGIGVLVFFLVMCGAIAYSQWYAYNVNVPKYQAPRAK
jgi:hypothetical protein